jgi:hypothetical protein
MAGAGVKLFNSGEVLTAAQLNQFIMDQAVTRFPDEEARDLAFGGANQPALSEGRICYLDDSNKIQFYDGIQWQDSDQFVVGDGAITEAKLAAGSVTSSKIGSGAVGASNIASGAITNTQVSASAAIAYSKLNLGTSIVNADVSASAAIADTKLATIASSGKVSNSATTATSANTASAIVARDASGDFVANKSTLATVDVSTVIETALIVASPAASTVNINFNTSPTVYYTGNSTADWTLNVRGTNSVTLNNSILTGQIATVTFIATNGSTAYRPTVFQVDGSAVTPKWMGGTAPTTGNANSLDAYTLAIIKTGAAAFTVLASQTRFA